MPLSSLKLELLRAAARTALGEPFVRVLGKRRRQGADAALDPQVAAVLELQRLLRLPALESMDPPRARAFAAAGLGPLDVPDVPMDRIVDISVGGVPVRRYEPIDRASDLIVYFHGGGGVIGSIAASEPAARLIAAQTNCTVASVDYRLGPEHVHPAAVDDAIAAYAALCASAPPKAKIAIAGDSFGGYLVAYVDRLARERGLRVPDLQVLIYPLVDQTTSSPSIDRFAEGYLLTKTMIEYFRRHYLSPSEDRLAASPIGWPIETLRGAAPALVVTAGFDPLVDEGDAYADRLRQAGVTVRHRRHDSLVHGFLSLAGVVRVARTATDDLCDDIRAMLQRA